MPRVPDFRVDEDADRVAARWEKRGRAWQNKVGSDVFDTSGEQSAGWTSETTSWLQQLGARNASYHVRDQISNGRMALEARMDGVYAAGS